MNDVTPQLLARAAVRGEGATTTAVCAALGEAVDAGIISLGDLLALVRSCEDANQLGDALTMLAATVDAYGRQMNTYGASFMTFRQWLEWRNTPQPPRRFKVVGGAL